MAKAGVGVANQVTVNHDCPDGVPVLTGDNHLPRSAVSADQTIERGHFLGDSGTTGTSTSFRLHLKAYVDGQTVDHESLV